MSTSAVRLLCSGFGVGYLMNMDSYRCIEAMSLLLPSTPNVNERNHHRPYSSNSVTISPTYIRSLLYASFCVGVYVVIKKYSIGLDDIMYVTKRTFDTVTQNIEESIESTRHLINNVYKELQMHIGIVEEKVDKHSLDIKKQIDGVQTSVVKLDHQLTNIKSTLEQKLQNAARERQFVAKGVQLLCKTVGENIDDSNELQEFCSIPMAQYVFPSKKVAAMYEWSTRSLYRD